MLTLEELTALAVKTFKDSPDMRWENAVLSILQTVYRECLPEKKAFRKANNDV